MHPEIKFSDSANIFSKLTETSNNFHENKIKSLEKYLKEISVIAVIITSRPFKKFFEFEENYDEEVEREMKGKYNYIQIPSTIQVGVSQSEVLEYSSDEKIEEEKSKEDNKEVYQ